MPTPMRRCSRVLRIAAGTCVCDDDLDDVADGIQGLGFTLNPPSECA